jgi:lipoyl(octanoyl) transferase
VKLRVIDDRPLSGKDNMKRDLELLDALESGLGQPTLRFYDWEIPTVSLGRVERPDEADFRDKLESLNIPWVRRPTGGRSIYHSQGSLTYSVVLPTHFGGGTLKGSYQLLSEVILTALQQCGVSGLQQGGAQQSTTSQNCFEVSTLADLELNGHKIMGAAQLRKRQAFLQHGVIYLSSPDITGIFETEIESIQSLTGVLLDGKQFKISLEAVLQSCYQTL